MLLRPSNAINKADSESRHVVTVAIEAEKASTRDLKSLHGIWQKRHFNTEGKNLMVFDTGILCIILYASQIFPFNMARFIKYDIKSARMSKC